MSENKIPYVQNTMNRKVIYVYEKNYDEEKGYIKIGDASIDVPNENFKDDSEYLRNIAEKRIRSYELTSPINILYVTYAVRKDFTSFRDYQVHEVLERSGIKKIKKGNSTEWFKTDLRTAKEAIDAVKSGFSSITNIDLSESYNKNNSIKLRPEQNEAIKQTKTVFEKKNDMLWNAKMRFGKTLSSLELIKQLEFNKTLILTHRPIVNDGWYEDFNKIFYNTDYKYGSKKNGAKLEELLKVGNPFIYFASIQDLRGSKTINKQNGLDKNEDIFNVNWDFVIIDEAHEGTKTTLAEDVVSSVKSDDTKVLKLSGTPFNLLEEYDESQIYTWDYVMEQEAKKNWDLEHNGDANPYSSLPQMEMYVYELGKIIKNENFVDYENHAFNFSEFFRTSEGDEKNFIYENEVWNFLNLISRSDDFSLDKSNMPFSTIEYRKELRHTLWTLPSISSCLALEKMLNKHQVFSQYNIANLVSSENEEKYEDMQKIRNAITNEPEENYSITLTVRRGTVGTTVREWTGILVLNNTESASNYLQSIFRVQSPFIGKEGQKEKAYVFDFAPDRSLKMISQAAKLNVKSGGLNNAQQKEHMTKFLNFLPIIGIDGSSMSEYSVEKMLIQLKRAQAERAVRNGFDDTSIYNDELLKLTFDDLKEFEELKEIIGVTKQSKKVKDVEINNQGLSDEEWEQAEQAEKKNAKDRTEKDLDLLKEKKKLSNQRKVMISILRGISIRIPLMIYGMDIPKDHDITIENFTDNVDDTSWSEFMPLGVTKGKFRSFTKFYDAEVFIEAGHKIRSLASSADRLSVEDRIEKITSLFAGFKNPDKETVLTPWRVVNMHLGETIGGYNFFDPSFPSKPLEGVIPRYVSYPGITENVFKKDSKILEINSKTGLYPLYIAYSIYKERWNIESQDWYKEDWVKKDKELWEDVLINNIFVINKTPMARTITYRTLNGYNVNNEVLSNMVYIEDLNKKISNKDYSFIESLYEKGINMNFDVIVGNPPYQEVLDINTAKAKQLFPHFIMKSIDANASYVSLITPARWFAGKGQDGSFLKLRDYIKEKQSIEKLHYFPDANDIFQDVSIKGGINYFLYNKNHHGETEFYVHENEKYTCFKRDLFIENMDDIVTNNVAISIIEKVKNKSNEFLTDITTGRDAFGISGKEDNIDKLLSQVPENEQIDVRCKKEQFIKINRSVVKKNIDIMNAYKVFVSKSAGDPKKDKKVIGVPYVGDIGQACTDTFIPIGCFKSKKEAENLKKYLSTRFVRYLISTLKTSQNVYQIVYKFVPLFDFSNYKCINWEQSINEVENQLFKYFELNTEEINEIKEKVSER